jgi:hypothetical protein
VRSRMAAMVSLVRMLPLSAALPTRRGTGAAPLRAAAARYRRPTPPALRAEPSRFRRLPTAAAAAGEKRGALVARRTRAQVSHFAAARLAMLKAVEQAPPGVSNCYWLGETIGGAICGEWGYMGRCGHMIPTVWHPRAPFAKGFGACSGSLRVGSVREGLGRGMIIVGCLTRLGNFAYVHQQRCPSALPAVQLSLGLFSLGL